jgi:hypothetical protein
MAGQRISREQGALFLRQWVESTPEWTSAERARTLGICLIGTDKFTPAQFLTLRRFIESFRRRYPGATLHGHREFSAKACPGFDLRAWIEKGMPNGFKGHSCDVAHGDSKP